jgi:hypothetical protein
MEMPLPFPQKVVFRDQTLDLPSPGNRIDNSPQPLTQLHGWKFPPLLMALLDHYEIAVIDPPDIYPIPHVPGCIGDGYRSIAVIGFEGKLYFPVVQLLLATIQFLEGYEQGCRAKLPSDVKFDNLGRFLFPIHELPRKRFPDPLLEAVFDFFNPL